jgi:general secretion pathway protein D
MRNILILILGLSFLFGGSCKRLFSLYTQGDNSIVLQNIITDISDICHINVLVKDNIAKEKLKDKLKYIKLKDLTLEELLDYVLGKNGFFYQLKQNTLVISYIKTKNFKIDYVNNTISGSTNFSASTSDSGGGTNTLSSQFNFDFWKEFSNNIRAILTAQVNNYFKNPEPIIDKSSGLVTITGTKNQLDRVESYIKELNKRLHKEVLIDVKIYSIRLTKNHQTGINWDNFNIGIKTSFALSTNKIGQTIIDSSNLNMDGVLNFLSRYGQVNSISNPKITTLNNQKAIITVGETINYSYKTVTTDANGNAVQSDTIDSKFVGILLDITPEISDENVIIMNINPSVSSISSTQLNNNLPPNTMEKKLNTIIRIKDGSTIILGGLITDDKTFIVNGVPVLKEIPVIKHLFSYKGEEFERKELVFVITPHIIDLDKKTDIKNIGYTLPKLEDM